MMNNPMMGSPIALLLNAMQMGRNPTAMLNQMAASNPQIKQVLQMAQGKSPDQLRQMAINMARERGVSLDDVARQLGITLPGG